MARKKLSVRIQLITLCPLIIGILICTILAIAILFDSFKTWVSDTKDYIKDSEYDSLSTLSQVTSSLIGSKIRQRAFELNSLNQMYSSSIELASEYQDIIKTVNYYKITDYSADNKNNKTLWLSNNKDFDNFDDYEESLKNKTAVIDVFMKAFVPNNKDSAQIGMVVNKDSGLPSGQILDYRFPIYEMDFVNESNSNSECGKQGEYSSVCTDSFQTLKSSDSQILTYTEENSIKVLQNSDSGAFIYYLPQDYFDSYFLHIEGYSFFISDASASRIIRVIHPKNHENDYEFDPSSTKVSENIFKSDEELSKEAEKGLNNSKTVLESSDSSQFEVEGYYSTYYASVSYASLDLETPNEEYSISEPSAVMSGVYINRGYVYEDYYSVLDDIIDTIIIQMVIFLILLGLTCFIAWVLAVEITERIIEPIYLFERFLRGRAVSIDFEKNYNKEVNRILNFLRLLRTLESMIEPRFFLHPDLQERQQNLKDSLDLFESINNKRGKSIILNLLGNIEYMRKNYSQAVEYYTQSVNQIEELIKEVETQSKGEKELTDEEKEKLGLNLDKTEKNWEVEKTCLTEMVFDKKQQLCMGLSAEVKNSSTNLIENRSKLKDLIKIQKQILQFNTDEKLQYFNVIKLVIDIAGTYKDLKYFHSAVELLDLVIDELKKLEMSDGQQADIDVGRLCKLGLITLNDKSENPSKHFETKGYTFEKDILMQMATHNKGKIFIEYDKPYEAALSLSASIVIITQEKGAFYDPNLRMSAVNSLTKLLQKKNCQVPESLQALRSNLSAPKHSVLFLLAYDLSQSKLNTKVSAFIRDKLDESFKVGAVTLNSKPELRMKAWQRDSAKDDFDELVRASTDSESDSSVLDAILLASDEFDSSKKDRKVMIVILDKFTESGFGIREDLALVAEKEVYLYILAKEGAITNNGIIQKFNEVGASFTEFQSSTLDQVLNSLYKVILDS